MVLKLIANDGFQNLPQIVSESLGIFTVRRKWNGKKAIEELGKRTGTCCRVRITSLYSSGKVAVVKRIMLDRYQCLTLLYRLVQLR